MSRKTIILLFILIILPVVIYLIWPTDEARIKKLIKEAISAVEKEDIDGVMSKVSFNYHDEYGQSYLLLKRNLERQFRRFSDIEVEYENLEIEVKDDTATASMDMRVIATLGEDRGYFLGDIKEPVHLVLEFEKTPVKKWLVLKASGFDYW
jgi:hypothetical protein